MRKRAHVHMTKIVLSISLIILFGRLIYAGVSAIFHMQDKQRVERESAPRKAVDDKYLPPEDKPGS